MKQYGAVMMYVLGLEQQARERYYQPMELTDYAFSRTKSGRIKKESLNVSVSVGVVLLQTIPK